MSSEERETMNSDNLTTSEDDNEAELSSNTQKLFILGFIPKAPHNISLKAIAGDLFSQYFVSWNSPKWLESTGEPSRSRTFLSSADALIFFVNEQTLRNSNCLLTLQYAWHSMVPIIMLRPPSTKLVISNRGAQRSREKVTVLGDGSIVRNSNKEPWQLLDDTDFDAIDYGLLQDVLHEGFKISTLYDEQDHDRSMSRIRRRLSSLFHTVPFFKSGSSNSSSQPHFYLSPSNHSLYDKRADESIRVVKSRSSSSRRKLRQRDDEDDKKMKLNLSLSTGNLHKHLRATPYPGKTSHFDNNVDDDEEYDLMGRKNVMKSPPPPERVPSSIGSAEVHEIFSTTEEKSILTPKPLRDVPLGLPKHPHHFKRKTDSEEEEINADQFTLPPLTPMTPGNATNPFSATSGAGSEKNTSRSYLTNRINSVTSYASSTERRMSLSCIEDLTNYQRTQYLVYPLRDSNKKPYLIRFPEDMHEEEEKHTGSVWGSDESLEEEVKLASRIISGIHLDYMDESPITSPAPYLGDLL